jgi:hypothetical protein
MLQKTKDEKNSSGVSPTMLLKTQELGISATIFMKAKVLICSFGQKIRVMHIRHHVHAKNHLAENR